MKPKDELLDELTSKVYFLSLKVERLSKEIEELKNAQNATKWPLLHSFDGATDLPETD